ncbi:SWIM zinc finger family protein [Ureibacillus sp. MALMAid1270]|uniref:SWIM zinc finger family protein n=1 Tax=Ureibacillus sp. MALMAid1270 TaxID=3411629 RepID=UPI003BA5E09E
MNLNNFEQYVEPIILERGNTYYRQDLVEQIIELGADEYSIEVLGSESYEVYIALSPNKDIIQSKCNCPYDYSNICKHQVVAFYALKNLCKGSNLFCKKF